MAPAASDDARRSYRRAVAAGESAEKMRRVIEQGAEGDEWVARSGRQPSRAATATR
jgi:hypothetical protein